MNVYIRKRPSHASMLLLSYFIMAQNLSVEFQFVIYRQGDIFLDLCSIKEHRIMDWVQRKTILYGLVCEHVMPR